MKEENLCDYKVCVKCFTYNQSLYIEDALDGFCMQHTTFPYVCVIVDDASTDGEQKVLTGYLERNFDLENTLVVRKEEHDNYSLLFAQHKNNKNCYFAVFFLKYNHYSKAQSKTLYYSEWQSCSKYLAFCEGDDFWIDTHKLQRQVDFLEEHPEYNIFFHNAIIRYDNQTRPDRILSQFETGDFDAMRIFEKWQLPLASVLLRREILDAPILAELNKVFAGGLCLFITAAKTGKAFGLSECLSVYRKNDGGISNLMRSWELMDHHYGYARVINDVAVLKHVDEEAFRRIINCIPRYILGDESANKVVEVVKRYNKKVFYKALLLYPFYMPGIVLKKLKRYYYA